MPFPTTDDWEDNPFPNRLKEHIGHRQSLTPGVECVSAHNSPEACCLNMAPEHFPHTNPKREG